MNDIKLKDTLMDDNNKDKLLGCPLCGSVPSIVKGDNEDGSPWMVICSSCDCYTVGFETKEEAINKWNGMERCASAVDVDHIGKIRAFRKIAEHYNHAREKHPDFATDLFNETDPKCATFELERARRNLETTESAGCVIAETVLNCEICEAIQAFTDGDKDHAVEECYDAIAVLLRIVDVIEGRQKLGNNESTNEAKLTGQKNTSDVKPHILLYEARRDSDGVVMCSCDTVQEVKEYLCREFNVNDYRDAPCYITEVHDYEKEIDFAEKSAAESAWEGGKR